LLLDWWTSVQLLLLHVYRHKTQLDATHQARAMSEKIKNGAEVRPVSWVVPQLLGGRKKLMAGALFHFGEVLIEFYIYSIRDFSAGVATQSSDDKMDSRIKSIGINNIKPRLTLRLRRLEFLHLTGNRSSFVMCLRRYI
jgi:hypothetical protein